MIYWSIAKPWMNTNNTCQLYCRP
uniref:Uncharacterized protein n=1 Tax=Arundo donax TaxID=35708 RepID=A0A0A9A7U3_ARUDO